MGNNHALPVQDVAGLTGDWCSCTAKQACEDANPPSMRPTEINEAELRGDPSELPHVDVRGAGEHVSELLMPGFRHRHLLGSTAHAKDPTPAAQSATYVPSQVCPISRLQPQITGTLGPTGRSFEHTVCKANLLNWRLASRLSLVLSPAPTREP